MDDDKVHAVAFAVSGADGRFVVSGIEPMGYDLSARADDRAPAVTPQVTGGARDVTLVLARGPTISGAVTTTSGEPVPAFTLVVFRRDGVVRDVVLAKSIVHPGGVFEIPIREGAYELVATAGGWAASKPTPAQTGDRDVAVTLSAGAVLRGRVVSAKDQSPLAYARVMREALSGGASAQPSNAGTVTREDGTFELSGIPPGPVSVTVVAGGHHPRIEAGLVATDGGVLGPVTVALTPLAPGEKPLLELVGIGVALSAHGDLLAITKVMEGGGAAKAGIVLGDKVAKVDGVSVTELGLDGAVARIRGAPGTTVRVTIVRVQGGETVELVVERVAFKSGGFGGGACVWLGVVVVVVVVVGVVVVELRGDRAHRGCGTAPTSFAVLRQPRDDKSACGGALRGDVRMTSRCDRARTRGTARGEGVGPSLRRG
jgi:hypothetical protein